MMDQEQVDEAAPPAPERPWAEPVETIAEALNTDLEDGLAGDEAVRRVTQYGPNRLRAQRTVSGWRVLFRQFTSVVILLLVAAMALAISFGQWPEAIAVAVVIIIVNAGMGFMAEWRAIRSMQALRRMGRQIVTVRRDGREQQITADQLVPGDVVVLEAEALVPADLRIAQADQVRVNEAALTGESVAVIKTNETVAEEAPLAERTCMLFRGTTVVEGSARGIAVATGMAAQIGRVSKLAQEAESAATPLQRKLDRLGRRLACLVIAVAFILVGVGYLTREGQTMLVVETAIALGVAAIPEGLPIVATIALARGMHLMARRNALINHLPAVETLGATGVIFTDKTGTLTLNRMTLRKLVTPARSFELDLDSNTADTSNAQFEHHLLTRSIEIGVLCNNAALHDRTENENREEGKDGHNQHEDGPRGDPMEVALLQAGREHDLGRPKLLRQKPEQREESFDPDEMKMATYHRAGDRLFVAVKGAPERVLEVCDRLAATEGDDAEADAPMSDEDREHWRQTADDLAADGLRVLAFADKYVDAVDAPPYEHLRLVAMVGLLDPPREDVRQVVNTTQAAGIRVVMMTGDQPGTALAIARSVGIVGDQDDPEPAVMRGDELEPPDRLSEDGLAQIRRTNIFARVSPEQKLDLVGAYQQTGDVVAMTGDGVNDAPALKKADIGVAMGKRGTDAAKQVADMVLTDDALQSITRAIERGRITFTNIRKSAMFMLCTNVAEVVAVAVAFAAAWTIPIRPLQILYLNMLTDVLPALALSVSRGEPDIMAQPPRDPHEAVLTRQHWQHIIGWGLLIAACVLTAMMLAHHWLGLNTPAAVTTSFLTLGFAKLWFPLNLRRRDSRLAHNEITANPWLWLAIGLCAVLLVLAVYLPGLSDVMDTYNPGLDGWALAIAMSAIPVLIGQIWFRLRPD